MICLIMLQCLRYDTILYLLEQCIVHFRSAIFSLLISNLILFHCLDVAAHGLDLFQ